jgi:hypothetical protein
MLSNEIVANFEHSFLYDGKRQLKIKYNPKVTFTPPPKAKGKFTKFVVIPVIVASEDSELYFDDFSIKITKAKK